jgi:hypothetical protein
MLEAKNTPVRPKKSGRSWIIEKCLIKVSQQPHKPLNGSNQIWATTLCKREVPGTSDLRVEAVKDCNFMLYLSAYISPVLKVSKFQNKFVKSSFLPKYELKIVRISAL